MSRQSSRAVRYFYGAGLAVALAVLASGGALALDEEIRSIPDVSSIESFHSTGLVIHVVATNPDIFILDFPEMEQQGRMFSRALALIERQGGSRDRVLTDPELSALIQASGKGLASYAYGNDFRVSELARFFNMASDDKVALNEEEMRLRDFLLANGALTERYGFYQPPPTDKVVISIPQSEDGHVTGRVAVTPKLRQVILRHEISHGEYFTTPAYADYCRNFWASVMTERQRSAFRKFLASKGYDPANGDLMINETQAYLIHTPAQGVFSPAKVGLSTEEVKSLVAKFWAGHPPGRLFQGEHPRSH